MPYVAPATIIGKDLVFTVTDHLTACTASAGVVSHLRFVDKSTIHAVRDDGTFDLNAIAWAYEDTGPRSGRLGMVFSSTRSIYILSFVTARTGKYESQTFMRHSDQRECRGSTLSLTPGDLLNHAEGTFYIPAT